LAEKGQETVAVAGSSVSERRDGWRDQPLSGRPGFLMRRLHQIHVALFFEECAGRRLTPVQYSVLTALEQTGECDQATLARTVGIDRTNMADVLSRLAQRKLIARRAHSSDKRMRLARLTGAGCEILAELADAASRAHERTVAALPPQERRDFIEAMVRLVEANNHVGRAPLRLG